MQSSVSRICRCSAGSAGGSVGLRWISSRPLTRAKRNQGGDCLARVGLGQSFRLPLGRVLPFEAIAGGKANRPVRVAR